jgi:hypothetical protein
MKTTFSRQFPKHTEISNVKKICPMGVELFHADGQHTDIRTDREVDRQGYVRKLIAAFCNSAKAPLNARMKMCIRKSHLYSCGPVKRNVMSMKMKICLNLRVNYIQINYGRKCSLIHRKKGNKKDEV